LAAWLLVVFTLTQDVHSHAARPQPSAFLLQTSNRPVPLRHGIGAAHHAVTTSSRQAQAFYDQGLAYPHSFVFLETAQSFNQALRSARHFAPFHYPTHAYENSGRIQEALTHAATYAKMAPGGSASHARASASGPCSCSPVDALDAANVLASHRSPVAGIEN
jgi:hypothetical protein